MTKVEIILSIICDDATSRAQKFLACTRVEGELSKIDGVKKAQVTNQSQVADVTVLAEWEEDKIADKLVLIRAINGIKEVEARILIPLEA